MDTKSATSGWHYREITCTEFFPKGLKNVDVEEKYQLRTYVNLSSTVPIFTTVIFVQRHCVNIIGTELYPKKTKTRLK
jgi:hypothetical protein